ncbi:MAG TPA: 2-aminoethylphosphonate ABC transporter permease subunit [Bordetella sp.]|uniref:2-aminoethylphosphonate ABC transporter permease subunit n=1 Tax=Bordetella sp. TaxID=28081 RepID=UPI002ED1E16E
MPDILALRLPATPRVRNAGWVVLPILVIAVLFFYPLALIVRQAFAGDAGAAAIQPFLDVLHSRYFGHALLNTVEIATAATAGCLVLGLVLALILTFVPFPGCVLAGRLVDTFIALPTFLVTLAFTFIYGSAGILNSLLQQHFGFAQPPVQFLYSAWGVIFAEITVYLPFVLRPLLASLSLMDPSQIEVASTLGARPWRVMRQIILPAAFPALIAGGSLCLLLTINEFGVVLFIGAKGVTTLPLLIYSKAIQESDYQAACIIAVINIVLSLGLFGLYRAAARRLGA